MLTRRSWFVYAALLAIWTILIGWQAVGHVRYRKAMRAAKIRDAFDWSNNLGILLRSQQRGSPTNVFVLITEQLEASLNDQFVKEGIFYSVVLLNATNDEVASVGEPIDLDLQERLLMGEIPEGRFWNDKTRTVTILNPVDLGTNMVVLSRNERFPRPGSETNSPASTLTTNSAVSTSTNATAGSREGRGNRPDGDNNPPRGRRGGGGRPPRITPEIIQDKGVHNFIITMPTNQMLSTFRQDMWLRAVIGILATIAVAGSGLAWANLTKTSELQIRLVRASELNSHLKEMNLAAAGLAHETRNPLNIVRGLAQMISRQEEAPSEIRTRSREIIEETDRITAQLNEFINYSRPREVRRAATNLNGVIAEVVRALNFDVDEKKVQIRVVAPQLTIAADEQLLRQALFNLVLNAIQAVPAGGEIQVRAGKRNGSGAYFEVADNGPGVAPEHRAELFKPYFTTHEEGTGLGLAVVQQIILAHGWDIECLPNQPSGAIFRVSHIKTLQ